MKRPLLGLLICTTFVGSFFTVPVRADDDPKDYFEDQCLDCHHRKKKPIEDKHMSRAEWAKAMDKMLELEKLDPVPPKAYIEKLLDWLAATHGPVGTAAATGDAAKHE